MPFFDNCRWSFRRKASWEHCWIKDRKKWKVENWIDSLRYVALKVPESFRSSKKLELRRWIVLIVTDSVLNIRLGVVVWAYQVSAWRWYSCCFFAGVSVPFPSCAGCRTISCGVDLLLILSALTGTLLENPRAQSLLKCIKIEFEASLNS